MKLYIVCLTISVVSGQQPGVRALRHAPAGVAQVVARPVQRAVVGLGLADRGRQAARQRGGVHRRRGRRALKASATGELRQNTASLAALRGITLHILNQSHQIVMPVKAYCRSRNRKICAR